VRVYTRGPYVICIHLYVYTIIIDDDGGGGGGGDGFKLRGSGRLGITGLKFDTFRHQPGPGRLFLGCPFFEMFLSSIFKQNIIIVIRAACPPPRSSLHRKLHIYIYIYIVTNTITHHPIYAHRVYNNIIHLYNMGRALQTLEATNLFSYIYYTLYTLLHRDDPRKYLNIIIHILYVYLLGRPHCRYRIVSCRDVVVWFDGVII